MVRRQANPDGIRAEVMGSIDPSTTDDFEAGPFGLHVEAEG
jgi:hypothetical protein